MKERIFIEFGFGNKSFISTEIEEGKKEYRMDKFVKPRKIKGIYLRFWLFKKVLILSTCNGISLNNKPRNNLKIILGIEGEGLK